MREYETIYVVKPDLSEDLLENLKEKVTKTLKKSKGQLLTFADWGKRKLAYEVGKFSKAQYFYLQYLAAGPSVFELERILKFDDNVLKFLTVKLADQVDVKERTAKKVEAPLPPEEMHSRESEFHGASRRMGGDRYSYEGRSSFQQGEPYPRERDEIKKTSE